ncbi:MAG: hypothetical protein JXR96_30840 [Deltaproteobacteria bacterium]|nr:hypothetical protein [Deltaproteobacteria bacterium]
MTEQALLELACSNCGAPVQYESGEVVLACAYCGTVFMLEGERRSTLPASDCFLLPLRVGQDEVRQSAQQWMATGFFKPADLDRRAKIELIQAYVLPVWAIQAQGRVDWTGTVLTTSDESHRHRDNKVSSRFQRDFYWPVLARLLGGEVFGTDALKPGGLAVRPDWGGFVLGGKLGQLESEGVDLLTDGKQVQVGELGLASFDVRGLGEMKVLHGQMDRKQAEQQARRELVKLLEKEAREDAGRAGARLLNSDVELDIARTDLVYLPVWQLVYRYGRKAYRMLFEPRRAEVVAGEHPVGVWDKVLVLAGLYAAGAGVLALLAHFAAIDELWYLVAGAGAIGLVHAVVTAMGHGKDG